MIYTHTHTIMWSEDLDECFLYNSAYFICTFINILKSDEQTSSECHRDPSEHKAKKPSAKAIGFW